VFPDRVVGREIDGVRSDLEHDDDEHYSIATWMYRGVVGRGVDDRDGLDGYIRLIGPSLEQSCSQSVLGAPNPHKGISITGSPLFARAPPNYKTDLPPRSRLGHLRSLFTAPEASPDLSKYKVVKSFWSGPPNVNCCGTTPSYLTPSGACNVIMSRFIIRNVRTTEDVVQHRLRLVTPVGRNDGTRGRAKQPN